MARIVYDWWLTLLILLFLSGDLDKPIQTTRNCILLTFLKWDQARKDKEAMEKEAQKDQRTNDEVKPKQGKMEKEKKKHGKKGKKKEKARMKLNVNKPPKKKGSKQKPEKVTNSNHHCNCCFSGQLWTVLTQNF